MDEVQCPFLCAEGCEVAGREIGQPGIPVQPDACRYCQQNAKPGPQQLNSVTAGLIIRHLRKHDRNLLASVYGKLLPYVKCGDDRPAPITQKNLILTMFLSPGDTLALTAAVECIKASYGAEYQLAADTTCKEIWEHNPHVVELDPHNEENARLNVDYPLIHQSNERAVSFLAAPLDYIARILGRSIPLRTNRPHLYLSDEEKSWIGRVEELTGEYRPYWIINAGTKSDFTCKQWPCEYYQEVVNATKDRVQWVQIGEAGHPHPKLEHVLDAVGTTTPRELIRLAYWASGGLGPPTFLQHLCAAWQKPYLCLLGGREPLFWTAYPLQHQFHSIGALDCCRAGACWRSRVVALGDGTKEDTSLCEQPVTEFVRPVGRCMQLIQPAEVVAVLGRYL